MALPAFFFRRGRSAEKIEYNSKDLNGNSYYIASETGKINTTNSNVISMYLVTASIQLNDSSKSTADSSKGVLIIVIPQYLHIQIILFAIHMVFEPNHINPKDCNHPKDPR